jgi:ELWxxDGT repeat protein
MRVPVRAGGLGLWLLAAGLFLAAPAARSQRAYRITPVAGPTAGSTPSRTVSLGPGRPALFFADDGVAGTELWRTDLTAGGTSLVLDINPGPAGSLDSWRTYEPWLEAVPLGGLLIFVADDGVRGRELWRSDGTAAGTGLVADIAAGLPTSNPRDLTVVGSTVLFTADDGDHGLELWRTDGTAAGTAMVTDLVPGWGSALEGARGYAHLAAVGSTGYFVADMPGIGREMWRTDGTAEGTALVADIGPGDADGIPDSHAPATTALGPFAVFSAIDGQHGPQAANLFRTDVTPSGTVKLTSFSPSPSSPPWSATGAHGPQVAGGLLFFWRHDGNPSGTPELWTTDGTTPGTALLVAGQRRLPSEDGQLADLGGRVYFAGPDGEQGAGLWSTDGTPGGTGLAAQVAPDGSAWIDYPLVAARGLIYFTARHDATEGRTHLYRSDGAAVTRFWPPDDALLTSSANGEALASANGRVYFGGGSWGEPRTLWCTDGTMETTREVLVADGSQAPPAPSRFHLAGSHLFFTAYDASGWRLWAVDLDPDADGVLDPDDNCAEAPNAAQDDSDADTLGDACDACPPGSDADVDNACDGSDNCPASNPDQADLDGDGLGDACDGDADGDGLDAAAGDCDDRDLAALRPPTEVTGLRVVKRPVGLRLTWDGQDSEVGPGVRYEIAASSLRPRFSTYGCLAERTSAPEATFSVPGSRGFLVRAVFAETAACPEGDYGTPTTGWNWRRSIEPYPCP